MMMPDSNNILEFYNYQGNEEEEVPETVEKLAFDPSVQELPGQLCSYRFGLREVTLPSGLIKIGYMAFRQCKNLMKINMIPRTVEFIGDCAFDSCHGLTSIDFDFESHSPLKLHAVGMQAFGHCTSLERIKLPLVDVCADEVFIGCSALVEANLSLATGMTKIETGTFSNCSSLQTASLPNTLERISHYAFARCHELVTVVVPLNSQPVLIEQGSFEECTRLANFVLPRGSSAGYESFLGCELLHECWGEDESLIVAGLVGRFQGIPIHRMCYDHLAVTVQELQQCIADQHGVDTLVDNFGMTPLHVFFSTSDPSMELLEVLLESLPIHQLLKCEDANGKRPLDYLINNWTDGAKSLMLKTLQHWMIDPLARSGATKWANEMKAKVEELLFENGKSHRFALFDRILFQFEKCEKIECGKLLELALWKARIESQPALNRQQCRCLCGSSVVLPNVAAFV